MYRAKPADGIAWITGASSGIGRGVARELARRGYDVAVTARREDELRLLASEVETHGRRAFVYPGDVTDRVAVARMVADIEADYGAIALAFLNAGGNFRDPPNDFMGENFYRTLDLNLYGVTNALGPVARAMQQRGRGQIAICASIAGYGGLPGAPAYCASKAALIAMCESLRVDLGLQGIFVQAVCPAYVKTPLTDQNAYSMPFILELDDAVQRICNGLESTGFEIAFPRRAEYLMKLVNILPRRAYFALMRKFGMRRAR
jgi:NAD(P)-dependent dehydrogenase (short-subunit alcohol dehydrogenase family)